MIGAWHAGDPHARLAAFGAGTFAHVNGPLDEHLQRTAQLLRDWGSRDALCLAGLYHAVYGTAGIRGALVGQDQRCTIADLIGDEAEHVAYTYGACDRERYHPRIGTADQSRFVDRFMHAEYPIADSLLRDFCELTIANELELATQNAAYLRKHREFRALFDRMQGLVSGACGAAFVRIFGVESS